MKNLVLALEELRRTREAMAMDSLRVVKGEACTGEHHRVRESFCLLPSRVLWRNVEQALCLEV